MTNIKLPGSLSVNGKNMMRALASILQIDTEEHEIKTWSKNEGSIHGQCEVQYTFLNMEKEHHMEMTKVFLTSGTVQRETLNSLTIQMHTHVTLSRRMHCMIMNMH